MKPRMPMDDGYFQELLVGVVVTDLITEVSIQVLRMDEQGRKMNSTKQLKAPHIVRESVDLGQIDAGGQLIGIKRRHLLTLFHRNLCNIGVLGRVLMREMP